MVISCTGGRLCTALLLNPSDRAGTVLAQELQGTIYPEGSHNASSHFNPVVHHATGNLVMFDEQDETLCL